MERTGPHCRVSPRPRPYVPLFVHCSVAGPVPCSHNALAQTSTKFRCPHDSRSKGLVFQGAQLSTWWVGITKVPEV